MAAEQGGERGGRPSKVVDGGPGAPPPHILGSNWEAYTEPCVIRTVTHLIKAVPASVKDHFPFALPTYVQRDVHFIQRAIAYAQLVVCVCVPRTDSAVLQRSTLYILSYAPAMA